MISTALTSLLSGPAFGFQAVSMDNKPDTLGIPAGVDGLVREAPGVLRAVSSTVGADGIRHEHLLTYGWNGRRFQVMACNCDCCRRRQAPACRHALAADTLLNQFLVKSALLAQHTGQTGPCEIVRAWEAKEACFGCGAPTLYVHLRRPAEGASCRVNDRKTVCTCCRLWKHEG